MPDTLPANKDRIDLLQALLTPTIAFAAVAITIFQARINYLRFKHEMFDRRYTMYLSVRRFMRRVVSIESDREKTRTAYDDATKDYLDAIDGAPFIFNWNVDDYFIEIFRKTEAFLYLARGFESRMEQAEQVDRNVAIDDLRQWFDKQLGSLGTHSELDTRPERYLHLTQV